MTGKERRGNSRSMKKFWLFDDEFLLSREKGQEFQYVELDSISDLTDPVVK